jgi:hypothetical protein
MPESAPIVSAVLVHHVPGRVRLRIRKDNCNSLGPVGERLGSVPEVQRVELNRLASSVVVHYDRQRTLLQLAAQLEAAGALRLELLPPTDRGDTRAGFVSGAAKVLWSVALNQVRL